MTTKQAQLLADELFGIKGIARKLPGESNLNFLIKVSHTEKYVLKIAHSERTLNLQNEALQHLSKKHLPIVLPQVVVDKNGQLTSRFNLENGQVVFIRLLTWVAGRLLSKIEPHTLELMESLGRACGHLCKGLADFEHTEAHRYFRWDNAQATWIAGYLDRIETKEKRELVQHFLTLYEKIVVPKLDGLRKSINYNDANDYNVIINENWTNPSVKGLIDFGDIVFTPTINEVAIAAAYALMNKPDPLTTACAVVKGFHAIFPIKEEECILIFSLIAARLIISVTISSINQKESPDNAYLQISAKPAWDLLKKWREIPPALAHYSFRQVCGLEPCPTNTVFRDFIKKNGKNFASIVLPDLKKAEKAILDLGVGSVQLRDRLDFEDSARFDALINRIMEAAGVEISIGKYNEVRPLYITDSYVIEGNEGPQWRTVHIGLDIFMRAGTPVFAPLGGKVHSFQNNAADRDYGPTIILEHSVEGNLTFYTLYGHLGLAALNALNIGMPIKKGEQIATIGSRPVNGNWAPHLHFQVMLDLLGFSGDFPGVAFPHQRAVWTSLCPNPNLLIGMKEQVNGDSR